MARKKLKVISIWDNHVILKSLKRKSIYAQRKIVAKSSDNFECVKAYLSENGTEIFPAKATALCRVDEKGNAVVEKEKKQLEEDELDYSNQYRDKILRFSPEGQELHSLETFCGFVTGIYTLEDFDQALLAEIIGENIYRYMLASGKDTLKKAYVFQRNGTIFLLTYTEENYIEPAVRSSPPPVDDVNIYSNLDNIDFEML